MEHLGDLFGEDAIWLMIWRQKIYHIAAFVLFLLALTIVMFAKDRLSKKAKLLSVVRYGFLLTAFIYIGLALKAQPTTANLVIPINSLLTEHQFPIETFLMEPFLFFTFLFIGLSVVLWGRGVFCGWLCPYGAMVELLNGIVKAVRSKPLFRLSQRIHGRLLNVRYFVLFIIIGISFYNFILSEYLTEVEPFRTFVLKLNRQWYFVAYFVFLTIGSTLLYRSFCQYLCPLGAGLSSVSFLRWLPLIKLKRYALCSKCKICYKDCMAGAITAEGAIDARSCLYCLDCQVNYRDEARCPALIKHSKEKRAEVVNETKPDLTNMTVTSALAMLAVLLICATASAKTLSKTLIVDDKTPGGYTTISAAIKDSKDGDTIEVRGGRYEEHIKIDKELNLKGINNPAIFAKKGHLVVITSPGVTLEGFTLTYDGAGHDPDDTAIAIAKYADDVVIKNNKLVNTMFGIRNLEGINIRIINNTISGIEKFDENNRGNCMSFTGTFKAYIKGNTFSNCRDAMYLEVCHNATVEDNHITKSRYAIHTMWVDNGNFNDNVVLGNLVGMAIMYTKNSRINRNLSVGNKTHGLLINQTVHSEIIGNTVISNTKGMFLYNSIENTIESNLIMNNNMGLHNWGGSEDNRISKNSFIRNEVQVKYVSSRNQEWDNNYWSDYLGWDLSGTGKGDVPYESNTVVDHIFWRYPMAKLLFASPSLHVLKMLEKQFPIINVPKVIDSKPSMLPFHAQWKELLDKYANYVPAKYYGDVEKLANMPGGMY
ncbi:MAG: nitrous oxide reductase family maturation protein NosD [Nitrospirae bacterium]|nr:nitrous oxide reductase family maturation protein NosD [Nitrospirota bacterium]